MSVGLILGAGELEVHKGEVGVVEVQVPLEKLSVTGDRDLGDWLGVYGCTWG